MAVKCPKCHSENAETSLFCSGCGTKLEAAGEFSLFQTETLETSLKDLATGATFADRYQVIEELGKGGMGKVYKVLDTHINEKVALKLLKPEIAADRKTIERFSNELKFARKISHRNVCRMYDLGKAEGTSFITMEYVPGEDLKSMLQMMGQLSPGQIVSIGKQVCDGLAEAHSLGVIHRDLKPQNIMIDKGGNAKIMDFGIARSVREKGITGPTVLIGTPEYMSPEQAEAKEVDQRSDIYSLGIILYEMATGRVPFEGDTALSIALKHRTEIPKNPKQYNSHLSDDLSGIILKCLEKDRTGRYQTAAEFRSELERVEKGIPAVDLVVPKPKSVTSKEITVTFRLRRVLVPALIFIAVVVLGVMGWRLLFQKEPASQAAQNPSLVVLPFEDLSPQKDQEYFCEGLADSIINALASTKEIRISGRDSSRYLKSKGLSIQDIGRQLGASTVLDGSIQKAGDRLRVTARLTNVSDNSVLWSDQYNQELRDVFSIQDEISLGVVDKMKIQLLGERKATLTKRHTDDPAAYEAYLKGRYHLNKRTEEGIKRAGEYFQQAIDKDPEYSQAYAGLADYYALLPAYGSFLAKDFIPKAKAAAIRALEIDEGNAEAHTSLGNIYGLYEYDWLGEEREFKRAVELNPNYEIAHMWYGESLGIALGRPEQGYQEIRKAQELDPLSVLVNSVAAAYSFMMRNYDQGVAEAQKALELSPNYPVARWVLGMIYLQKGMMGKAVAELQKAVEYSGGSALMLSALGSAYASAGKKEEALNILTELDERSKKEHILPIFFSYIYTNMGDKAEALKRLEKAYEERSPWLNYARVDPRLDPLRSEPRFQEIMRLMNFPK